MLRLALGLKLWSMFGVIQADWVIVLANVFGATLSSIVLGCKVRDMLFKAGACASPLVSFLPPGP